MSDTYRPGDNWIICDECGFKIRASESRKRWDGMVVCRADWESRHPQDQKRGRRDDQRPTVNRPEGPDVFLDANDVTPDDL